MADKSIILHSELDSLDKYKNGKSITSTEKKKKRSGNYYIFFIRTIVGKDREAVVSFSLKAKLI